MSEPSEMLSAAGQERREAILQTALRTVRRRRRARRAVGVTGGVAAIVLVAVMLHRSPESVPQTSVPQPVAPPRVAVQPSYPPVESPDVPRFATIRIVGDDPTIMERLAAPAVPQLWRTIDDEELLAEMAAAGQPAGLARINEETLLLARQ